MNDDIPLFYYINPNYLEDRLDPEFYHPKYYEMLNKLNTLYELQTLGEISTITRILGFETQKYVKYQKTGIPYLRVQNIDEYKIDLSNVVFISQESHDFLKRSQLKKDDIVLTITGRVGTAAVVEKNIGECNASQEIVRIRLKEFYNPYFISAYLNSNIGKLFINRWQSGATRPRTLINNIRKIPIPKLDMEYQEEFEIIIKEYNKLLESNRSDYDKLVIDLNDYLKRIYDIKIDHNNSLVNIYVIKKSSFEGRLDSEYYHPKYTNLLNQLKSMDNIKNLSDISNLVVSGKYIKEYVESGVKYIRIKNIKKDKIDSSDIKYINAEDYDLSNKLYVKTNDIIIARTGATLGKSILVNEDYHDSAISQHVTKLSIKDNVNPLYVEFYLNSPIAQLQIERGATGSVQKELTHTVLKSILIPIPHESLQKQISNDYDEIKNNMLFLNEQIIKIKDMLNKKLESLIMSDFDNLEEYNAIL